MERLRPACKAGVQQWKSAYTGVAGTISVPELVSLSLERIVSFESVKANIGLSRLNRNPRRPIYTSLVRVHFAPKFAMTLGVEACEKAVIIRREPLRRSALLARLRHDIPYAH